MKNIVTTFVLFVFCAAASATIHTVSNAPHLPAEFATIQAAHDAASAGDTILLHGTNNSYGSLIWSKQLFIFSNTALPVDGAKINSIQIVNGTVSGSVLESVNVAAFNNDGTAGDNVDITLRRCAFTGIGFSMSSVIHFSNWLIEGCVFTQSGNGAYSFYGNCNQGSYDQFILRNNVFNGKVSALINSSFDHNVFLNMQGGQATSNCNTYCIYSNNIFFGASPSEEYYSNHNQYYNNLSYGSASEAFPIQANPSESPFNTGADNIVANDPSFVNVTINSPFNFNFDFTLASGSPCIAAGTDDSNLGVYDGTSYFRGDFEPTIPIVREVTIVGGNTVPAEGSFQINVQSVVHP